MSNLCEIPFNIGTMGFSYKDWIGPFYPNEVTAQNFLVYYSRIFNSVEIDSTFYGTPKLSTIQRWIAATPPQFSFSLKVPKSITHAPEIMDTWGLMDEFLQTIGNLGQRLGIILFQFPPSFTSQKLDKLADFLTRLPREFRFAIEVRHLSWYTASVRFENILNPLAIAWAATQYPKLPETIQLTTNFLYIRWIGQHGAFDHHNEERIDRVEDMHRWLQQMAALCDKVTTVFGYFNNDYAGFGAGSALKFKTIIGEPVNPLRQPTQKRLF